MQTPNTAIIPFHTKIITFLITLKKYTYKSENNWDSFFAHRFFKY